MSVAMTAAPASSSPPAPPGQLTAPPTPDQARQFLEALEQWVTTVRASLDQLDADAQLATDPALYVHDITLAMSLCQSITARRDELVSVWDSGRVGSDGLAQLALLMWGRLPDPLGTPSAFTLTEAGTLLAALLDRLTAALSTDAIAGSGVAGRIVSLRASLERCKTLASVLGTSQSDVEGAEATLDTALATKDRDQITSTVMTLDTEVSTIERDLIKETSARTNTAHLVSTLQVRYTDLVQRSAKVATLAERCRSRITNPPQLAVPDASTLEPPAADQISDASSAADWAVARAELDHYAKRLDRCAAALDEAEAQYGEPLRARDDLRGLLGAYRTRAARSGLAEDLPLEDAYRAAHDVLWSAPCDLNAAQDLVDRYDHAVRRAVGAERVVEPSPTASPGEGDRV